MPINVYETGFADVTKLSCRACGEKLKNVGLLPHSNVQGLSFKCRRCGKLWEVNATPERKEENTEKSQNPQR